MVDHCLLLYLGHLCIWFFTTLPKLLWLHFLVNWFLLFIDLEYLRDTLPLLLVAVIWGVTNPLMKIGADGLQDLKRPSASGQIIAELWFLVKKWKVSQFASISL